MVRRGMIEEWLKRIRFGGRPEEYIVVIRYRGEKGEELLEIPGRFIEDVRRGYFYVGGEPIPFHRVVEIRDKRGKILFSRIR